MGRPKLLPESSGNIAFWPVLHFCPVKRHEVVDPLEHEWLKHLRATFPLPVDACLVMGSKKSVAITKDNLYPDVLCSLPT